MCLELLDRSLQDEILDGCIFDVAMTGDHSLVCTALASLALDCELEYNLLLEYSTDSFCRMFSSRYYTGYTLIDKSIPLL